MAKSPVAGRVKRRLGREIGDVAAIRFYRICLSHTALRLAQDRRWRTLLAIDPDRDVAAPFAPSRETLARVTQGNGDLGRRMQRLFSLLPPGPAIIVGSDIPAIEPNISREAFRLLGRTDAVLGPAADGGYWLIGLKRTPKAARAVCRSALVGPARSRRHARQSQGQARRLRRDAHAMSIPRMTIGACARLRRAVLHFRAAQSVLRSAFNSTLRRIL